MEKRLFEDLIDSDRVAHKTQQSKTLPVSLAAPPDRGGRHRHRAAPGGRPAARSRLRGEGLLRRAHGGPAAAAAAAAARRAGRDGPEGRCPSRSSQNNRSSRPSTCPQEIKPEEGIDLGVEGGVAGGVEGGVPGGVVGGVVGGLPDAPPPPPQQAVRVGGQIKEPKKLKNGRSGLPGHREAGPGAGRRDPRVHDLARRARSRTSRSCAGIPLLDQAAIEAVKQWVYTPTLLNGVPVPVIMTVTVNFKLS